MSLSVAPVPAVGVSYSTYGLPPGLTIDQQTGLIHGAIDWSASGAFNVTVSANNGVGSSVSFAWNVTPEVMAMDALPDQSSTAGDTVSVQAAAHSLNPSADVYYSATSLPGGSSIDPQSGLISGQIDQ